MTSVTDTGPIKPGPKLPNPGRLFPKPGERTKETEDRPSPPTKVPGA